MVITTVVNSIDTLPSSTTVVATPIVNSIVNLPTANHSEISHDHIAASHAIQQTDPAIHIQTQTTTTAGVSFAGPPSPIPVSQSVTTAS